MLLIKMTPMEADAAFPYNTESETPTGEIDLRLVNQLWEETAANAGPYPEVKGFELWVIIDCFNGPAYIDDSGDELVNCATAMVNFVDGTSLPVTFACLN